MGVFIYRLNLPLSEAQTTLKFLSVIQVMQRDAAMASNFQYLSIEYLLVRYLRRLHLNWIVPCHLRHFFFGSLVSIRCSSCHLQLGGVPVCIWTLHLGHLPL